MTFNLLHRDWITVRYLDGTVCDVSLLTAFRDAAQIDRICGELPSQDAAILRLMLAVLYRALPTKSVKDAAAQVKSILDSRTFGDAVETYLMQFEDRFDLLDPVQPFMQVPAGTRDSKGRKPVEDFQGLTLDVMKKDFSIALRAMPEAITFAEAARWVVHCHQADTGGRKTALAGNNGYGYGTMSPAVIGLTGCYFADGESLLDTLTLNLVGTVRDPGLPYWEHPQPDGGAQHRVVTGTADLYTWQSRRIILISDGEQVVSAVVACGDAVGNEESRAFPKVVLPRDSDPLIGWRPNTDSKVPKGELKAAQPSDKGVWVKLLNAANDASVPPVLIDWLAELADRGAITTTVVPIRAIRVDYVSGGRISAVDDMVNAFPVRLAHDPDAVVYAQRCAEVALQATHLLGILAENLARAAGWTAQGSCGATTSDYATTGAVLTAWLPRLLDNRVQAVADFPGLLRKALYTRAEQMVARAGSQAAIGNWTAGGLMTASTALDRFGTGLTNKLKELQ